MQFEASGTPTIHRPRHAPTPAPLFKNLGLALVSLHLGIWRSAACSLKVLWQWGHCTMPISGPDGAAGIGISLGSFPEATALLYWRLAYMADRSASDLAFQLFLAPPAAAPAPAPGPRLPPPPLLPPPPPLPLPPPPPPDSLAMSLASLGTSAVLNTFRFC